MKRRLFLTRRPPMKPSHETTSCPDTATVQEADSGISVRTLTLLPSDKRSSTIEPAMCVVHIWVSTHEHVRPHEHFRPREHFRPHELSVPMCISVPMGSSVPTRISAPMSISVPMSISALMSFPSPSAFPSHEHFHPHGHIRPHFRLFLTRRPFTKPTHETTSFPDTTTVHEADS